MLRLASDERLVKALRGGSEAAFEVIYTRHHRGVLSFCRHMLGSAEEAEDALQHTFLAAYRDLQRSDRPIRLRPWLYAIARNRCLTVLRARREPPSDAPVEPATEHLSHEVERRDDLRALLGDLAALPPDQRAALVLAELGDMSHEEIGHVVGCPREKVKGLVFQARSSLIASRTARETPCEEIRQQLANLRGGSLRRNTVRRHLRDCEGCREFREQVVAQRDALALILPVAPTLGLKATVLGAAGVTAAAGGGTAAVVTTTVVTLCVAGGGTAAVDITRDDGGKRPGRSEPRSVRVVPAAAAPEPVAAAAPKTRRGSARIDRGRPDRHRRAAVARPDARKPGNEAKAGRPKPGTGKGSKVRGPKAGNAEQVRGPKVENARGPKAEEPRTQPAGATRPDKPKAAPSKRDESNPAPWKPTSSKPEKASKADQASPADQPVEVAAPAEAPKPEKAAKRG